MQMKIKAKLLLMEAVSLFVLALILVVASIFVAKAQVDTRIEETLKTAVYGYSGDVNYLRDAGIDIDITVFTGDTRTDSSITSAIGTQAADTVIEQVLDGGQILYQTNVFVNGEAYYGYYIPTEDGMLFAGKPRTDVSEFMVKVILILCGCGIGAYIVCLLVTLFISNSIAGRIQNIAGKIQVLAEGDLSGDIVESAGTD